MGKHTTVNIPKTSLKYLKELREKYLKEAAPGEKIMIVAMDDSSFINWLILLEYHRQGFTPDLEGADE